MSLDVFSSITILITFVLATALNANANELTNNLKSKIDNIFNETLTEMFPMAEFGLSTGDANEVTGSIIAINPLSDVNDKSSSTFFLGSLFLSDDSRETINLGLATRSLVSDDTMLIGTNIFYDHELDYNHRRGSLGGEIKSSIIELNTNHYFAISDKRTGKNNVEEEVADGYD